MKDPSNGAVDDPGEPWDSLTPGSIPEDYRIPDGAPRAVREAIVWALGQLGTPYQWGGTCTDPHGSDPMGRCDCSSLMQQSYAAAGVALSRTTFTQVHEGRPIAAGQVEPGDLLFTTPGADGPGHVGMYLGSGLVVHAPKTGDVVRLATWETWKPQLITARRIVG